MVELPACDESWHRFPFMLRRHVALNLSPEDVSARSYGDIPEVESQDTASGISSRAAGTSFAYTGVQPRQAWLGSRMPCARITVVLRMASRSELDVNPLGTVPLGPAPSGPATAVPTQRRPSSVARRALPPGNLGFFPPALVQDLTVRPKGCAPSPPDGAPNSPRTPGARIAPSPRGCSGRTCARSGARARACLRSKGWRQAGNGWSEREQREAYEVQFGAALVWETQRLALLTKQPAVIDCLGELYARPVEGADACRGWLAAVIARRLDAAGSASLGGMVGGGLSPASVSARRAARMRAFRAASATGAPASGAARGALVQLDTLMVPPVLDDSAGADRRPHALCLLEATKDNEAAARLRAKRRDNRSAPGPLDWVATLSHTERDYREQAERVRDPVTTDDARRFAATRRILAEANLAERPSC